MARTDKPADFSAVSSSARSTTGGSGAGERADFSGVRASVKTTADLVPPATGDTYTVKGGDTLSHIAKQVYGDAHAWNAIYAANRDQLDDPDLIRPGQVLRIPPRSVS